jgi:DNA-binding NarL/FixJ family response regulator
LQRATTVLVVDDFAAFRRFVSVALEEMAELRVIGEASDGLRAVQKAQELKPELILLDIGLPKLNGIEAARQIRKVSPASKILFVSEYRAPDIVEEALRSGALGYVVKSDAARDLLPAVASILRGARFISAVLATRDLVDDTDTQLASETGGGRTDAPRSLQTARGAHHRAAFYSDDRLLLEDVTKFMGAALDVGNAAVVVATESHRKNLLPSMSAYGIDMDAAVAEGRYIEVDVADAISMFLINDILDERRFLDTVGNLIQKAAQTVKGEQSRIAFFGEGAHVLCAQGNSQAAIQDEKLCNQLVQMYGVDILCGYSGTRVSAGIEDHVFQEICAEHSAVYHL